MDFKIIWSDAAIADLQHIYSYVAQQDRQRRLNSFYATCFFNEVCFSSTELLINCGLSRAGATDKRAAWSLFRARVHHRVGPFKTAVRHARRARREESRR